MKKFSTSLNGYNKMEVNSFLTNVIKEYETMLEKLKKQDAELEELRNENMKSRNLEDTLNKTIRVAEDASNQMKRMAREESIAIINDAKKNASRIVNEALIKHEEIEHDAEELKRRVINFKRKFKQAVETEVEVIDEIAEKY